MACYVPRRGKFSAVCLHDPFYSITSVFKINELHVLPYNTFQKSNPSSHDFYEIRITQQRCTVLGIKMFKKKQKQKN